MNPEEFIAAVTAIHRYMEEHSEKPIEIKPRSNVWKMISRVPGW